MNNMTAANQYAHRPKDERYPSYQALVDAATYDRDHSKEVTYNLRDLQVTAVEGFTTPARLHDPMETRPSARVVLTSPKGQAEFTHHSFAQLARTVGAPAHYLRTLPPENIAKDLTWGLHHNPLTEGKRANLLVKANGGSPIVRAATSDTYGRVWDAELYGVLGRYFGDGCRSSQGEWISPPTWDGQPAGQYRGDRDSFVIRVDGGSIVTDPRGWGAMGSNQGGQLNRGILVRNSEVGHCSITLECILFDCICGNHILWGAVIDRTFRRRHVGNNISQKVISEILTIARRYNSRSASQDESIIRTLVEKEIANSREAVVDELKKLGFAKQDAEDAYDTCVAKEPTLNPRSYWGLAAGATRASQESGWQDERLALDQLAAAVLKRGSLVTV